MSKAGRNLQIGDECTIDFQLSGKPTRHKIVARQDETRSQSGIMFLVIPDVPKSSGAWIDADWFEPIQKGE